MTKRNILFISEIKPFPPNSGERIRSNNLIKSLLELSGKFILIAGNPPSKEKVFQGIEFYTFPDLDLENRWKNFLYLFRREKELISRVKGIIGENEIDLVVLDYNFIGQYIGFFKRRGIPVIYGTHNVQSRLNHQANMNTLKDRVYKIIRYALETIHERYFFKKADAILAVSDDDLKYYQRHFKHSKLWMIPNYIDELDYEGEHKSVKKDQVIMSGNFLAFQNSVGLKWFLQKVWDQDLASFAKLLIVGHGSKEQYEIIREEIGEKENVEAIGSVPNMKRYISESKAAIIPLLHGSGTRLKCVEAMALKTNIISTTIGVEGIAHDGSILVGDSPADFKLNLLRVLKDEVQNEDEAYTIFLRHYSSLAVSPILKTLIEDQSLLK